MDKNSIETNSLMEKIFKDNLYQRRPRRKKKNKKNFSSIALPGMNVSIIEKIPEDNDIYTDDKDDFYFNAELTDNQQPQESEASFIFIPEQLEAQPDPEREKFLLNEAEPDDAHCDADTGEGEERHFIEAEEIANHEYPEDETDFFIEEVFEDEQLRENNENGFIQVDASNDFQYRGPKIEVPVLIAQPDIDVNLVRNIDMPKLIASIVDVNWRVQIINSQLIVPTRHFFANGVLVADIQYTSDDHPGDLYRITVNIPWKKAIKVDFIYPPILPVECHKREYNFNPGSESLESIIHREQVISHSQHSISNLHLTRIVSTEHIQSEKQLCMQLNVAFSFNILQYQLVDVCS